jgi:hypothetical protein
MWLLPALLPPIRKELIIRYNARCGLTLVRTETILPPMKNFSFCFLFLWVCASALAQNIPAEEQQFIQLFSGQVFTGNTVRRMEPVFKDPYFTLDNKRYAFNQVKNYRDKHGYYISIGTSDSSPYRFAQRRVKGKINYYVRYAHKHAYGYWDTNNNDFREATDANIREALASSPDCMRFLKRRSVEEKAGFALLPVGLGCLAAFALVPGPASLIWLCGYGACTAGMFVWIRQDTWEKAIRKYDKEFQ